MMSLYVEKYDNPVATRIEGYEDIIFLPDMPPFEEMVNYGLPVDEQIFRRTSLPSESEWEGMSIYEKKSLAQNEWHKRLNGFWMLLGGKAEYIPGWAYFFFNYWIAEIGDLPDFRMEAVWYYQLKNYVFHDKNTFGTFDIKGRRIGDTEKELCYGYDLVTRYRKSWFGMQNLSETDAQDNFLRVIEGHKNMKPWFKASTPNKDDPKKALFFMYPSGEKGGIPPLNSRVDFRATKLKMYDGKRLRYYHGDEPGKTDPKVMNVYDQWRIIQPCLSLNNLRHIVGKAGYTTTVENIKDGATIKVAGAMWEDSNPQERDGNGRTQTGLVRIFRPFWMAAETDKFGYPKKDEAIIHWQTQVDEYIRRGKFDEAAAHKRKFPMWVHDALKIPAGECPLYPEILDNRIDKLRLYETSVNANVVKMMPVRGDLEWSAGRGSDVVWRPNQNGRWLISMHPPIPNMSRQINGRRFPGNTGMFTAGIDPVDHRSPDQSGSKLGIAVFCPDNPSLELPPFDSFGNPNEVTEEFKVTDRFVCTYLYRPVSPFDGYDAALKTLIYYGVPGMVERDKPGLINMSVEWGLDGYMAWKPATVKVGANEKQEGVKASAPLISLYVDAIKEHVYGTQNHWHIDLLQNYRNFDGTNQGKLDLLVASGLAKIQAGAAQRMAKVNKGWDKKPWA